jgi:Lrp/AsnC family leucine-responsive transcriptional regulator
VDTKNLLADRKNIQLLRLLQKKPRATVAELARQVGMSSPAVKERLVRLEESGVLEYRVDLNPRALGYSMMALVRVRPLPGHSKKVAELLQAIPQVTECHAITGEDCFVLRVHVKDISHLDDVLDKVLAHAQTTTSIVRSTPVSLRNLPVGEPR